MIIEVNEKRKREGKRKEENEGRECVCMRERE